MDDHVGLRAEGLQEHLPLGRQLLVLEVSPDLLPEAGLVALKPGLVGLVETIDLLLGDQPDFRSNLGVEQGLEREASLGRLLGEELLGDQRLDLLPREGVDLLLELGQFRVEGLLDLCGRDRLPVPLGQRRALRRRLGTRGAYGCKDRHGDTTTPVGWQDLTPHCPLCFSSLVWRV